MNNDIKLGPTGAETLLSPLGRTFTQGYLEFGRSDRTQSGRGVKEITALKRIFTLSYDIIDNAVLEVIKGYYELEAALSLIVTQQDASTVTYDVLMQPFDWDRLLASSVENSGLWTGPGIVLEEI